MGSKSSSAHDGKAAKTAKRSTEDLSRPIDEEYEGDGQIIEPVSAHCPPRSLGPPKACYGRCGAPESRHSGAVCCAGKPGGGKTCPSPFSPPRCFHALLCACRGIRPSNWLALSSDRCIDTDLFSASHCSRYCTGLGRRKAALRIPRAGIRSRRRHRLASSWLAWQTCNDFRSPPTHFLQQPCAVLRCRFLRLLIPSHRVHCWRPGSAGAFVEKRLVEHPRPGSVM